MPTKNECMLIRGVITGDSKPSDIVLKNGVVKEIKPATRRKPDGGSKYAHISTTLFDIQVNGGMGIDLQNPALTPEDVAKLDDFMAGNGVSHWIPTVITASKKNILHACGTIAEARKNSVLKRAIPGVHIEGPYISPVDGPRGAHAKRHVRKPSLREFDEFMKAADGHIAYVTIAPELDGAIPFIKGMMKRGVKVSLGHHNASPDIIERAVQAGAELSTHLGNGIAGMIDRYNNPLWPQLDQYRLYASLIADLEHLPPHVLRVIIRAKSPGRTILTSDCTNLAGLKPGKYKLGECPVEMLPSGRICLSGTPYLAGSSLLLLQGAINCVEQGALTFEQAIASASSIPGRFFKLRHKFQRPQIGKKADLIVFNVLTGKRGGMKADIKAAFVNGTMRTQ